jgi:hypothetical protein
MKLPLQDVNWLGGERATINALVKVGSSQFTTTFLTDTGSPLTIICMNDIQKTRIPYSTLPTHIRMRLIVDMDLKILGEATLTFRDGEQNTVQIQHPIYVGILVNKNQELVRKLSLSFLGKDLLDKFNWGISKKDEKGIRYLE